MDNLEKRPKKFKLSIVTIGKFLENNLDLTFSSIDEQINRNFEHVVVLSDVSNEGSKTLHERHTKSYRRFIINRDNSIYDAMNLGLNSASGSHVFFLNSGDTFWTKTATQIIEAKSSDQSCTAFGTIQTYGAMQYLRMPKINTLGIPEDVPHQGFVAPLKGPAIAPILFNDQKYISADQDWIRRCSTAFGITARQEIIGNFILGGLSNRPSIRALYLRTLSGDYCEAIKELIKLPLYWIVGPATYYSLLARWNGYESYHR